MSENVEDLYLKGFMAYSSKDYKTAVGYWKQVLAIDPNHEKARQGLASLKAASKKKRSSKDVLQEIKKLYAEKHYAQAMSLCEKLLKRHPENADLQGLFSKIEKRFKEQHGQEVPEGDESPFETTRYFVAGAEASIGGGQSNATPAADVSAEVERHIQRGVSLYEIQDYENAIVAWKEALKLDPNNRIAQDYIKNVGSLVEDGDATPEPAAAAPSGKPSKDELISIYNEAMGYFKSQRYQEAIEKWNYIIRFHPNHKETIHCLERAQDALAKEQRHQQMLDDARDAMSSGNHAGAAELVATLMAEAPNLDGVMALNDALEQRERQISELRSLEIEQSQEDHQDVKASDEEITRYFTPDAEDTEAPRQVTKVNITKKTKKPLNLKLLIGVPLVLAIIAAGGYGGYEFYYKPMKLKSEQESFVAIPTQTTWDSVESIADKFLTFGNDFRDEQSYQLAIYSYERVEQDVIARLEELKGNTDLLPIQIAEEDAELKRLLTEAKEGLAYARGKVGEGEALSDAELSRLDAQVKKNEFDGVSERIIKGLIATPESLALRTKLADIEMKIGFKYMKNDELDEASKHFRIAMVCMEGYSLPHRHIEALERFWQTEISEQEKDQWFYFFIN